MSSMTRRTWLGLAALAPLGNPSRARAQRRPFLSKTAREVIRDRYFPNVLLRTHENERVRFYDDLIKDKIVLINFMYAHCEGICPPITANLVKVQGLLGERVGRDIFFYSLTLKPKEDTPAVLKHYAQMHRVGPGWLFLTGDPDDMELLRVKLGFTDPDPVRDADTANHIGNVRYGNEALQLWGGCPGGIRPQFIVEALSWVDRPKSPPASA